MAKAQGIIISAPASNHGKTTVALALASALQQRGFDFHSFKLGPDYLDPLFQREVLHIPSYNLDQLLLGERLCQEYFGSPNFALVEGAMGYYDGVGSSTLGSTYEMSKLLKCPTILVIDPKGQGLSAVALATGFASFKPEAKIQGVILNRLKPALYPYYQRLFKEHSKLPLLGFLPELEGCSIPNYELGLLPPAEVASAEDIVQRLGEAASKSLDLEGILDLGRKCGLERELIPQNNLKDRFKGVKLAVTRDENFFFYYADSLEWLKELGVKLCYFSPSRNESVPDAQALYLGGGYLERCIKELSANNKFLDSVRVFFRSGRPILAEGAGAVILSQGLRHGEFYELAGLLPLAYEYSDSLVNFGYAKLRANKDSLCLLAGEELTAQQFHHFKALSSEGDFTVAKISGRTAPDEGQAGDNYLALQAQIMYRGCPELMLRLLRRAEEFS
ncbi:MAG: cobyrinate a,c-diamide synthase [Eubacteriales bacterium]|nr:cobyrinate a,c-diamide synthase [Eubacteriales bacterium]